MNKEIDKVLRSTLQLLHDTTPHIKGSDEIDKLLPLLTLLTQELILQKVRGSGQEITPTLIGSVGANMQQLQANPASYPALFTAFLFGYIYAGHKDELMQQCIALKAETDSIQQKVKKG